jgi:hypothetical protein
MKKIIIFIFAIYLGTNVQAQLRINSSGNTQIGYSVYNYLTFGIATNGKWAMEHWATDGGFNIWKPYPEPGYGNYKFFISDATSNVGIGKVPASNAKLDVAGNIYMNGNLVSTSDMRLKKDIVKLNNTLDNLLKLNGVSFKRTNKPYKRAVPDKNLEKTDPVKYQTMLNEQGPKLDTLSTNFGLLAQDVQAEFPELVTKDNDGYLKLDYLGLIPVLIESIKQQNTVISNLNTKITNLEKCCDSNGNTLKSTELKSNEKLPGETQLFQNNPNPFNQNTEIGMNIALSVVNASIVVFNMQGTLIKTYPVNGRGSVKVTISSADLEAGMYLYSLLADGKEIDTKRMILTK